VLGIQTARRRPNSQARRLRHFAVGLRQLESWLADPLRFPTKRYCILAGFRALIWHRVGGIASRVSGGRHARVGRTGQLASLETNMKIIDVPQSGHLGTFITFKTRHGQSRRRYVIPRNPQTPAQSLVRSRFSKVSARWRTLTDEQRAAWTAGGAQVGSHGRLGDSGTLTGCQFFVKINTNLANIGEPMVVEPPNFPAFEPNPVGDITITNIGGVVAIKLIVSAVPAHRILVLATAPCSPGASFPGRFAFLGFLPDPVAGISDITRFYVAKYGEPPANRRVFIHTVQQVNGWQDAPKRTTAVVPSA
jgi:hypothetical protein